MTKIEATTLIAAIDTLSRSKMTIGDQCDQEAYSVIAAFARPYVNDIINELAGNDEPGEPAYLDENSVGMMALWLIVFGVGIGRAYEQQEILGQTNVFRLPPSMNQ